MKLSNLQKQDKQLHDEIEACFWSIKDGTKTPHDLGVLIRKRVDCQNNIKTLLGTKSILKWNH
jgi:hypothetical protein